MLVAAARDLITLFLGLELISIPTYVLLILGRRDAASEEATVKYFFLSILSSALLLYGFSFLYGLAGSTRLDAIALRAAEGGGAFSGEVLAMLALALVVGGLGFKLAIVPFHFYAPDVYQGTTNLNAGLLAVVPKLAGLAALVRLLAALLPAVSGMGWLLCLILAMATMTLGNVVALWQVNIRRLLAYSSIAHAGYMLIGVAVWLAAQEFGGDSTIFANVGQAGLGATWLYMVVYVVASLGTFAALVYLGSEGRHVDEVEQLSGLSRTRGPVAAAIAVFMFSLAGIPPLAGFWGKLGLFNSALTVASTQATFGGLSVRTWFLALAIVGVLNAAISAAYYLRVVAVMYFSAKESTGELSRGEGGGGAAWATAFCAVTVFALGLFPGPLVQWTNVISKQPAISSPAVASDGQAVLGSLARTADESMP
jgi:NADH-quinone oxidoreductase subunit N